MGYDRIYKVVHDITLALRSIERTITSRDAHDAINKMSRTQLNELLQFIRDADVHAVRTLISTVLASQEITTMSYAALRERASRLRIPRFNKMHKGELVEHILATEEVLRDQLIKLQKPRTGFVDGDGI